MIHVRINVITVIRQRGTVNYPDKFIPKIQTLKQLDDNLFHLSK